MHLFKEGKGFYDHVKYSIQIQILNWPILNGGQRELYFIDHLWGVIPSLGPGAYISFFDIEYLQSSVASVGLKYLTLFSLALGRSYSFTIHGLTHYL